MLRVVLDTNVLVSAYLVAQGAPAQLRQAFRQGVFALVVTDAVLAEYRRVLNYERIARRHGLSPAEVDREIGELRQVALVIQVWAAVDVVTADPDDNVILACALAGQAPFLVSGDPHLPPGDRQSPPRAGGVPRFDARASLIPGVEERSRRQRRSLLTP